MIQQEKKTFAHITIVTMCFNMGMSGLSAVKGNARTSYHDYYIKSVERLCDLFKHVIVFCDEECYSYLVGKKSNVYLVCMKLQDLEKMNAFQEYSHTYEKMKRKLISWNRHVIFRHLFPQSPIVKLNASSDDLAKYTVLNHSKVDLMCKACKINPFNTEYFYWLDGGCIQERYELFWENWSGEITQIPKGIRCSLHMKEWSRLRFFLWTRVNIAYCFCEDQMAACFFGGRKENIIIFKKKFDDTVKKFLNNQLITSEQGIITWMIKEQSSFFDLVRSYHYNGIIHNVANGVSKRL